MICSVCAAPQACWQEACMNEHDKKKIIVIIIKGLWAKASIVK